MEDKNKIKLLIITPTLQCGGSEKFVALVCDHINNELFSVCLVVVNNSRPFYKIKNPAIKLLDLKKNRVLFSLTCIKRAVKDFAPDIIFSTANHLNLYLAIFRNRFGSNTRFIAREASIVSINSKQAKMPVLYNRLIKKYYRRFDMIICQSAYMKQDLIAHYHIQDSKAMVIHNSTAAVVGEPVQRGAAGGKRTYKFLTVARLSAEKGIERLIHAVGLLSVPFKYYIVGDGPERDALQKLVYDLQLNEKVFFAGQKDDPFSGMEDADLFLMGSYYEGFPNVLLEAGAHGLPVVAFNAPGGIAEIITGPENGLLVEDNDPIAFGAAIKKALAANFDRNKIIGSAKDRFSINSMMAALENTFLNLATDK